MTATRKPSNRSGAKKKPTSRASSKRTPAKKPASPRAKAAPVEPPLTVRMLDALAVASRGHGADFAGIVAIVLGILAGLGVYADAGGPLGEAAASGVGYVVGAARVVAPVVLVALGILLVRGAPVRELAADDPTLVDEDPLVAEHPFARSIFGSLLVSIAALGLLHLLRDAPRFSDGADALA
ncbi:MAG: hypothetical protein KDB04_05090, partial [Acidimicrobiales bacterium]|nr:hypothetical protein [Acidimicrobiales bacterium]